MIKKFIYVIVLAIGILFFKLNSVNAYETYKFGDKVTYRNINFYVIEDSDENSDYVYVVKDKPFSVTEVKKYGKDADGNLFINKHSNDYIESNQGFALISFYTSDSCYRTYYNYEIEGCNEEFQQSDIKKLLDNWKNDIFKNDELKVVNGNDVRLLSMDDLISKFGFEYYSFNSEGDTVSYYTGTQSLFNLLGFNSRYSFDLWLMDSFDDSGDIVMAYISDNYSRTFSSEVYYKYSVLPSLYIKKCAFNGTCEDDSDEVESNNYESYLFGDSVQFRGEKYYVLEDSESNKDYVTLIKEKSLTIYDIQKYGQQANGLGNEVIYQLWDYCDYTIDNFLLFEESNAKIVVDGWANDNFYDGELKRVNGYKTRVLDFGNEDKYLLDYTDYPNNGIESTIKNKLYLKRKRYSGMDNYSFCSALFSGYSFIINPIINLKKCALEGTCVTTKKEVYYAGDVVTYNGEKYHVLKNSDKYTNYVTLLKDNPLTKEQIEKYYDGEVTTGEYSGNALVEFTADGNNSYNRSIVNDIVKKWAKDEFSSSLVKVNNYSSKILSTEDLVRYLGYEWGANPDDVTNFIYRPTENTPDWYNNLKYGFWLLTPYEGSLIVNWSVSENLDTKSLSSTRSWSSIRPVVNVDKCLINPDADSCLKCKRIKKENTVNRYKEYSIGEKINYKGQDYYVLDSSDKDTSYIKLLKSEPLSASQINEYGKENGSSVINRYTYFDENDITVDRRKGLFVKYYHPESEKYKTGLCVDFNTSQCTVEYSQNNIGKNYYYYDVVIPGQAYVYDNNYGGMQYYSDETCGDFNGKEVIAKSDENDCSKYSNYDLSNIKVVVDNWTRNELDADDLVEIDGYKTRLINKNEYVYFKDNINVNPLPDWLVNNDYPYWAMDAGSYGASTKYLSYTGIGEDMDSAVSFHIIYPTVRPVIFLNKCVLENGCIVDQIDVASCYVDEEGNIIPDENDDPDDPSIIEEPVIVDVPKTSKMFSKLLIVLSCVLAISGAIIFINNYYKSKSEKK